MSNKCLRDVIHPSMNEALKSNAHNLTKLIKTAGEFVHNISSIKKQYANGLLSAVETFRKKSAELKKDRSGQSSSMSTWETFLGEYEREAQDILKSCQDLTQNVSKPLADEAAKRKALCKKVFAFREAGENRIEKAEEACQKNYKDYCDACSKLNKTQNTEQAKEGKQEHYTTLSHNAHNSYTLQLAALNSMQDIFYSKSLPQLLDDLQSVLEEATISMAMTFKDCTRIEREKHEDSVKRLSNIEKMFELVDSSTDTVNFVQNLNNPGPYMPQKREFQKPDGGHVVSVPDNKLSLNQTTEDVLRRKYIALEKKSRHLSGTVEKERGTLRSVRGLRDSYMQNPSYGKAEDVDSNIIVQMNEVRVKEMHKGVTDAQINLFTPDIKLNLHITDMDLRDDEYDDDESLLDIYDNRKSVISNVMAKPKTIRAAKHDFVEHTFKKPVFCHYCNKLLKGFLKQGVKCKTCRMCVHAKCQENVPNCSGSPLTGKRKTGTSVKSTASYEMNDDDFDDFDDATYSDVDESPTPPIQRKPLPTKPSDPGVVNDFYDTAEECLAGDSYAVALYEYAGENVGDLKLSAGNRITLTNTSDHNWWEGKCNGKSGFFPASYVQKIKKEDLILRCLFDFTAQEQDELSVAENQIIVQVADEGDGWVIGRAGNVEGAIPSTYVEKI